MWIYDGKLAAIRAGRQLRVSEDAVKNFISSSGTPGGRHEVGE
jgi:excisionase family DNA binding protein